MDKNHQSEVAWHLLTVVGEDRPGIVAGVTASLYKGGCNLGETSMCRLGGLFTIMMMVSGAVSNEALEAVIQPAVKKFNLRAHVDKTDARLHDHKIPNVQITIYGADRAGIVAETVAVLSESGMDILDLNSDVAGSTEKPVYVLVIDGDATQGLDHLKDSLASLENKGIEISLTPLETMVG
ncbi:MAG: glycine cleavage system protein R [Acidiferrobacterales bacterium]